ncbi:hypothetical protein ACQPW1_22475 [Nocardia sp. CA-128927]|uniref:hypothetical protein n=1 Tax=Nocardia sp. CA-128927 TaxID=3239975 RepID=UPI003D9654A3
MNAPTRTQVKVLRTLQNQTVWLNNAVATATQRQQQTGQSPPPSWYEDYHGRAILHEELTNAARAGGVPKAWIDHVHERGQRGVAWRADLYLRAPEVVEWNRILGDLDLDVRRLREWASLDVACAQLRPETGTGGSFDFDRNLNILRSRTAGVANLLGLTAEQGHQLWGDASDWAQAGAAALGGVPAEGLLQRWRAAAHTNLGAYGLQSIALAAAGVTTATTVALPSPEELSSALDVALEPVQPLFRAPVSSSEAIHTALSAANLTYDTDKQSASGPGLFSDAPRADGSSFDPDVEPDIPVPEFISPAWGLEQ